MVYSLIHLVAVGNCSVDSKNIPTFAQNLSHGLTIRFEPEIVDQLRKMAAAKGIGPTTLVRMWVMEKLAQTTAHSKS